MCVCASHTRRQVLEELPAELCDLSTLTDLSAGYNRLAAVRARKGPNAHSHKAHEQL